MPSATVVIGALRIKLFWLLSIILFCLPSIKRFTLKGKNLLPVGAIFFPFRVNPFSESLRVCVHTAGSISVSF